MKRDRTEELRDAIFYAVQEIISETDDSDAIYARTDEFMEKVDALVVEAVSHIIKPTLQLGETTWTHDGVAFHLTEM